MQFACPWGIFCRLAPWWPLPPANTFTDFFISMKTTFELEFADVAKITEAALAFARNQKWAITVAVVDAGGHLLALQRMDGAAPMSAHVAMAKAHASALGRRDTKVFEDMINGGRNAFLSVPTLEGLMEGALPVLQGGQCIGAVGVSGVKASEDAQVAAAGVAAVAAQ